MTRYPAVTRSSCATLSTLFLIGLLSLLGCAQKNEASRGDSTEQAPEAGWGDLGA